MAHVSVPEGRNEEIPTVFFIVVVVGLFNTWLCVLCCKTWVYQRFVVNCRV